MMFDWLSRLGFIDYDLDYPMVDWLGVERESLLVDRVQIYEGNRIYFRDEME